MSRFRFIVVLAYAFGVGGCADYNYYTRPAPTPAPPPPKPAPPAARTTPAPPPEPVPVPAEPTIRPAPATPMNPATLALMDQARGQRQSGDLDAAVVTLERAIRIQPRNAALWNQLAELRLQQHKPRLALDLAKKSNSLASGNTELKRSNWSLIAEARRMLGDEEGARRALDQAR